MEKELRRYIAQLKNAQVTVRGLAAFVLGRTHLTRIHAVCAPSLNL